MTGTHPAERSLALVAGAASGIGRELARVASHDGYNLILVARRADQLAALAEELSDRGTTCWPVVADLANAAGVPASLPRCRIGRSRSSSTTPGWAEEAASPRSGSWRPTWR